MSLLKRNHVIRAMAPSPWDLSNKVLYDLCSSHSTHTDVSAVLAKVMLIGRSNAVAIERRRNKNAEEQNEDFYLRKVAPPIMKPQTDLWLTEARAAIPGTEAGFKTLVQIHGQFTNLFKQISDLEKRSLASKYLHFHIPNLFYIYDSRAVATLRKFTSLIPHASRTLKYGDNEYRKFAEKCSHLVMYCSRKYGLHLSPRQLDNLLLRFKR